MKTKTLLVVALSVFSWAAAPAQDAQELTFPRVKTAPDGTRVTIYQPQVDRWDSHVKLEFRIAMEVLQPGAASAVPAAVQMTADTNTDLSTRTVVMYNQKVVKAEFPSTDEPTSQRLATLLAGLVPARPMKLSLDQIMTYMVDEDSGAGQTPDDAHAAGGATTAVRTIAAPADPPVILCSLAPAVLVLFDGEPVFAPVKGAGLRFAVNTNWDMFQEEGKPTCYLLNTDAWLQAPAPAGPWAPVDKLPKSFWDIPKEDNWADVHKNLPGKIVTRDKTPRVLVSYKPAELILLDGKPKMKGISGTKLLWATNTESDLFMNKETKIYYFLVSGRWFRAVKLEGPWVYTSNTLPGDFAKIPADHPRASVRASVPGTPEAREAVVLSQAPHVAEVKRGEAKVDVVYSGEPQFKPIEGTRMAYAVNTPSDVVQVGDRYYTCYQAVWFVAQEPKGPWAVADSVPKEIYTIPPSNPKYNVTYVNVYDSTPDTVTVGYTAGYMGAYVVGDCVVYGTGYYYPPYYYYPAGFFYPVYYPFPYTYGVGAYYNPYTGAYGRGGYAYGPYGGYGYAAAYNPRTGTYARGASAYGPYGGRATYAEAYNPRTGVSGATLQHSTPYQQWGQSVVTKGDDWARTGHYTDSRGTVAGFETSSGSKGIVTSTDSGRTGVVKGADNNVYAGHDGNVYKKTDQGWSKYENGSWNSVNKPADGSATDGARGAKSQESAASGRAGAQQTRSGGDRSRTYDQLDRDQQARFNASQRQNQYNSWRSGGGQTSRGGFGGFSRGGGGRRR